MKSEEKRNVKHVHIVIDTHAVIRDYPNPSQDSNNPTPIAHKYEYMVINDRNVLSGQGGADLSFEAKVGDVVRFYGTSMSNDFDNSLLIYGMPKYGGSQVFGPFTSRQFTRSGVSPSGPDVLPAHMGSERFWFFEAPVVALGIENYLVQFALYTRNELGLPTIFGYFQWDPSIVVSEQSEK